MPVLTRPSALLPAEQVAGTSTYGEALQASIGETLVTGPSGAADIAMRLRRSENPTERAPVLSKFISPGFALYDKLRLDPIKESRHLSPDEAQQQVKDAGLDEGDIPLTKYPNIRQNTLSLLIDLNRDKRRRQTLAQEYDGWSPQIAGMVIGSVIDPSNVALSFVPVVGEARYAQLLERVGSGVVSRLGVRAGVGAAEGAVGAALVEPAIYAGQQQWRNDYDAYDSMLNIAGGAAFGALLHGGAGLVKDAFGRPVQADVPELRRSAFADPDMVAGEAFKAKARGLGVSEQAQAALVPKAARDDVTGFFDGRQSGVKAQTVERALLHVERTGEPAYYVAADLANLGGLNKHVGNVAEAANVHYRAMAALLQDELRKTGGDLVPMRTGGDELGLVLVNADAQAVDMALAAAGSRIQEYAHTQGLSEIDNPKGGQRGVGLHTGAAAIVPGPLDDIFTRADMGVDASKRGVTRVNRNARATHGPGPDSGSGAGRVPAQADGGVRPSGSRPARSGADAARIVDDYLAELRNRAEPPKGDLKALEAEQAELAALLRENASDVLTADPRGRLSPDELAFVAQRQAEIRREQEAIRAAQGYGNELRKLEQKLAKVNHDSDFIALADKLVPDVPDVFAGIRPFVAKLNPETQAAAFRQALSQAATDRPIDISPALLANGDYQGALSRARDNAALVDGANPEAAAQAQARLDQPTPNTELEAARQLLADDKARLAERGVEFTPEESSVKIERDAVKAATLCLMRNA